MNSPCAGYLIHLNVIHSVLIVEYITNFYVAYIWPRMFPPHPATNKQSILKDASHS
jgi:hypothetical protein